MILDMHTQTVPRVFDKEKMKAKDSTDDGYDDNSDDGNVQRKISQPRSG